MPPKRPAAALLAAFLLAGLQAAWAQDNTPPTALDPNLQVTDCNNNWQSYTTPTSTGSPMFRWITQDTQSGIQVGRAPHVGGQSGKSSTILLLHMDESPCTMPQLLTDSSTIQTANASGNLACGSGQNPASAWGGARSWNGTAGQHIKINASASLGKTTDTFTIQAWINPNAFSGKVYPVFEFNNGVSSGVTLDVGQGPLGDGSLFANVISTIGVNHSTSSSAGLVQAGQWQMVTLTFNRFGFINLYLNDKNVASLQSNYTGFFPNVAYDAYVGERIAGGSFVFNGLIDEVRYLNEELSPAAVADDFYSGLVQVSTEPNGGPPITNYYLTGVTTGTTSPATFTINTNIPLAVNTNVNVPASNQFLLNLEDAAGNAIQRQITVQVLTGPPSAPGTPQGVALSTGSIQWTWSPPSQRFCSGNYGFFNGVNGALIASGLPTPAYTELGLAANALYVRSDNAASASGQGPLTPGASAYTDAWAPTNVQSTFSITTTSLGVSWNVGANPPYTRWEVSYTTDPNFIVGLTTPIPVSANYTSSSTVITGLNPSTTYYIRVRGVNGRATDNYGGVFTAFATEAFPTPPSGITLSTGASTTSSITWIWSPLDPTATGYTLVNAAGGILDYAPNNTNTFTLTGLGLNVQVRAFVIDNNLAGNSPVSNTIGAYTLANPPTGTTLTAVSTDTVSIQWNTNSDPAYTVFQVVVGTSSAFNLQLTTFTTTGGAFTVAGLLPGSTYYLRVRALNGDGIPTGFDPSPPIMAVTNTLSAFGTVNIPPSPYGLGPNTIAAYHFDESTGTVAVDASGNGNNGALLCFGLACSTPTYVQSFTGMGTALQYAGVQDSLCQVPHSATLDTAGSITIEAWVNPSAAIQIAGAGIVAKGGSPDAGFYSLDVAGNVWEFQFKDGGGLFRSVTSTQPIAVGQWTHVAGVWDESNNKLSIYVNGVLSSFSTPGVARPLNIQEMTIGSRRSGVAPVPPSHYDLPFAGDIDEVHVASAAFTAAQVLADYLAARQARVSLPAPPGACLLLQPNAFPNSGDIETSSDPLHFPLVVNPGILQDALATPPTGQTLIPGSLIEIVASIGGFPFTGTLGSPATLCLPYPDPFGTGLVSGTSPPVPTNKLAVYTLNPITVSWVPLANNRVDLDNKLVYADTPHFSIFALFGPSGIKPDTKNVRIYPVPWQPGSGGRFDSATIGSHTGLVFDNLPSAGFIRILTLSGELVNELDFNSINQGTVVWDGRNRAGRDAASGVYFAYVKSADGTSSSIKKFAIER